MSFTASLIKFIREMLFEMEKSSDVVFEFMELLVVNVARLEYSGEPVWTSKRETCFFFYFFSFIFILFISFISFF